MVKYERAKGIWWFRVFGYGLHWKDTRAHPLLFSQRAGFRKGFILGSWRFEFLKPEASV